MKIAIDAAKFTSEEANQLRKAMATFRSKGISGLLQEKMVGRMIDAWFDPISPSAVSTRSRVSANMASPRAMRRASPTSFTCRAGCKWKYPAAFACRLLNSQPMGFYAPAQIVRDAKEHGVEVLRVDVNHSIGIARWKWAPLRLGLSAAGSTATLRANSRRSALEGCEAVAVSLPAPHVREAAPAAECRCTRSSGWRRRTRSGRSARSAGSDMGLGALKRRRNCLCSSPPKSVARGGTKLRSCPRCR